MMMMMMSVKGGRAPPWLHELRTNNEGLLKTLIAICLEDLRNADFTTSTFERFAVFYDRFNEIHVGFVQNESKQSQISNDSHTFQGGFRHNL